MKKSRYTEAQVTYALSQTEAGTPASDVCRGLGISEATFYNWKKKYGDNAACKGFFGMLKRERVNRKTYRTMDIARADVFNYIECFHNPRMRRRIARIDQQFSDLLEASV